MRVWDGSSADCSGEPGTWDVSLTDATLASGWIGIGGFSGQTEWDWISVSTDPATTPAPTSE